MRKSSWSTRRVATRFEQSSRRNKNLSLKNSCVNRTHRKNATPPGKIAGFSKIQSNFDDELAGVGPGEEHVDGVGGFLEAFHDGLAVFDLAEHFPLAELGGGFQEARSVVQEKEALDAKPLQKNCAQAHHAGIFFKVAGDQSADDHAAVEAHQAKNGLHDFAAYILEIDVDAIGNGGSEFGLPIGTFVVDGGVKAELFRKPVAFVVRSGYAHNAAATDLSNLTDDAPGCACGCGDNHRLALLGRGDFHAEESRKSVDA